MISVPFFSIIVPVYNKENNIGTTIKSVLSQSFTDYELILVNDGSTDSSLDVIKSFYDPRIVFIDKQNGGVSSARNTGILSSKGEYISFLDADDIWDPNYLYKMKDLIRDYPEASFFGCQFGLRCGNDFVVENDVHSFRGYVDDFFKDSLKAPLVCSSSIIVKKTCFDNIGLFNIMFSRSEDIDVWMRLARKYKMAFEPSLLSYYIIDAENRISQKDHPLAHHYYDFKIWNAPLNERRFLINRASFLLAEKLRKYNYKDVFTLFKKYNIYIPHIIFVILYRKFNQRINK